MKRKPLSPRWVINRLSLEILASVFAFHVLARHSDTIISADAVVWVLTAFTGTPCTEAADRMNSVAPTLGWGFPVPEFFATIVIRAVNLKKGNNSYKKQTLQSYFLFQKLILLLNYKTKLSGKYCFTLYIIQINERKGFNFFKFSITFLGICSREVIIEKIKCIKCSGLK